MSAPRALLVLTLVSSSLAGCEEDRSKRRRVLDDEPEDRVRATASAPASAIPALEAEAPVATAEPAASAEIEATLSASASPPDPHLARQQALRDAADLGMIGLLNSGSGATPPTASLFGDAGDLGGFGDLGALTGNEIGSAFGTGGLGLSGVGGPSGSGEGIGLGSVGSIGHGAGTGTGSGYGTGSGRLGGTGTKPPSVRMGATSVSGSLPPEVIQRIVRAHFGKYRLCYEKGLQKDPNLEGRVKVGFTIAEDGSVSGVNTEGSDLKDATVVSCIGKAFEALSFPAPEGGVVKVSYPIVLSPGDSAAPRPAETTTGPQIAGKPIATASLADVEEALRDAGCTDVTSTAKPGSPGAMVITAKKDGKSYTVTFVPASAGANLIETVELDRLKKDAAVHEKGTFFLAVESETNALERALLGAIVKSA